MSVGEFSKCLLTAESNIPVPKRNHSRISRKTKDKHELPELQKYIENIIKETNDYQCDVVSFSNKKEKNSKCRRLGRNRERQTEQHIKLYDLNISRPKPKNTAEVGQKSEQNEDAEKKNDDKVKLQENEDLPHEKCLEKAYPNPYALEEVCEFKSLKQSVWKVSTPLDAKSGRQTTKAIAPRFNQNISQEKNPYTKSHNVSRNGSEEWKRNTSDLSVLNKIPNLIKSVSKSRDLSSKSSFLSSTESLLKENSKKNSKVTEGVTKPKNHNMDLNVPYDYGKGKLNLLSTMDFKEPANELRQEELLEFAEEDESELLEKDIFNADDLAEMRQIYDMMSKATESFLTLSTQTEKESKQESEELLQILKELNVMNPSAEKLKMTKPDESDSNMTDKTKNEKVIENNASKSHGRGIRMQQINKKKLQEGYHMKKPGTGVRSVSLDDLGHSGSAESQDLSETSRKIDEVIQFMYDCLINFKKKQGEQIDSETSHSTVPSEEKIKQKKSTAQLSKVNSSPCARGNNEEIHRMPIKEIQSECSTESGKKQIRPRCKRRQNTLLENTTRSFPRAPKEKDVFQVLPSGPGMVQNNSTTSTTDVQNTIYPDSMEIRHDSTLPTVEGQNELGGFTEEQVREIQVPKSLLQLSVKKKKSKTNSCEALKTALETEEKLMAKTGEVIFKKSTPLPKNLLLRGPKLRDEIKQENSNFVVCLNAFPRSLRSCTSKRRKMSCPTSVPISIGEVNTPWKVRTIKYNRTSSLKQVTISSALPLSASIYTYSFREEILSYLNQTSESHVATLVHIPIILSTTSVQEEHCLKNSECQAIADFIPPISVEVSVSTESIVLLPIIQDDDDPVQALEEAVERTEESVSLLEQNNEPEKNFYRNCESLTCSTPNEALSLDAENEKRKVHDLLLRTYNLQQKLHHYLQKLTTIQPPPLSCPLIHQETYFDISVVCNEQTTTDVLPLTDLTAENPTSLVYWCMKAPESETKITEVKKVDDSTSYEPPQQEGNVEDNADDRSSTYSFRSSNDFSEVNEIPEVENEPRPLEAATKGEPKKAKFSKKILKEIEQFKNSIEKKDEETGMTIVGKEEPKELVEYKGDVKTPTKILKTVFKGKESVTELSIGLKDVPMTKVSNITVEKKKFSSNHTKISVCIAKDKNEVKTRDCKKFPAYCLESFGPCVSTCRNELSRLEDGNSKAGESCNEESEDDDDDYKSVFSSLSESETELKGTEKDNAKVVITDKEAPPQKRYHRFDFYRKMDSGADDMNTSRKYTPKTNGNYKELEPLRQALTEMQIQMRSIKRNSLDSTSDEYYTRALKLAKMSAGFCQSCGSRSVIPEDTFGYYKRLLPRRSHRHRHFLQGTSRKSSFYSFRSSTPELSDHLCDLDMNLSSSYLLKSSSTGRPILSNSINDMPIFLGRM